MGHLPSAGDYDATTILSRFASPRDLERIAETRPDLYSILATSPSIPPRIHEILEQSDDIVVRGVLAHQAGHGTQSVRPTQSPVPGDIGPMTPTMAVRTAAGTTDVVLQQTASTSSGCMQVTREYGGRQPEVPGPTPQGGPLQGVSPRGYGAVTPQGPQGPPPQVAQAAQTSVVSQSVTPPPAGQGYSAFSMQAAAQPLDQQTAMPPEVSGRVSSEYGADQAYGSGLAYGSGQPAAPAYEAPMCAPPAPAPKKHRLLEVVAIVLPIILVLGTGGATAWYLLGRSEIYLGSTYATPLSAWANGANKVWSSNIDPHEDPYVFGDYLVMVDKGSNTLTAYSPLDDNMKGVWRTTADNEDFSSSYDISSALLKWGDNALVHRSTLTDLRTGKTSKAPWGESSPALVIGDTAISCKESGRYAAWGADKKQKWSYKVSEAGSRFESLDMFNAASPVEDKQRYPALSNAVINIDNGETLFLGGGSKTDSGPVIWYFQNGRGALDLESSSESDSSLSAGREYKVTVYDFKGEKQDGYRKTLPTHGNVVEEDEKLPTAEEHRTYFEDQDFSDANLTARSGSDGCITRIKPKQGSSINVPKAETNGIFSGCPSPAKSSEDDRIVKSIAMNRRDVNTVTTLISVKTRREVKFNGTDSKNGDTLITVRSDLTTGYNKLDDKVISFEPASQGGVAAALMRRYEGSSHRSHPP